MKHRLFRLLVGATCALLLCPPCVADRPERSVMGIYDYREITTEDGSAGIRLVVRLFNRSDEPVEEAEVILEDSLAQCELLGSFAGVAVEAWEFADLDGSFALPNEEIEHLRKGGQPRLYLRYEDEGEQVRLRIDLRRESLIEEVGP